MKRNKSYITFKTRGGHNKNNNNINNKNGNPRLALRGVKDKRMTSFSDVIITTTTFPSVAGARGPRIYIQLIDDFSASPCLFQKAINSQLLKISINFTLTKNFASDENLPLLTPTVFKANENFCSPVV